MSQEARQQRREQPVFVFRPLCPRGDEIREFESAWRGPALGDQSGIAGIAADVLPHHLALLEVLADVVEIKIHSRGVAPRGPFLVRRVERDVGFRSVEGIPFYEGAQGLIHILDHRSLGLPLRPRLTSRLRAAVGVKFLPDWATSSTAGRPFGHCRLPVHWPARPLWRTGADATLGPYLTAFNREEIAHAQLLVARRIRRGG